MIRFIFTLLLIVCSVSVIAKDTVAEDFLDEESNWEFDNFIRQSFLLNKSALPSEIRTKNDLFASYTRLRLGTAYKGDKIEMEASGNGDFIFANYKDTHEFQYLWMSQNRNRMMFMEKIHDENDYLVRADVHRLNVSYNTNKLKLKLGRQSISWGQGRFINPLDLITPTGPFILDMEDIQGADGIDANWYLNSTDFVEMVITPYRRLDDPDLGELYYRDTNALLRYKATFKDADIMVLGGHHFHSWVWGGDINLTKWDASFRAGYLGRAERDLSQYAYYDEYDLPPQVSHQGVLGASYAFAKGKYRVNFESFFNSSYTGDGNEPALAEHQKQEGLASSGFTQPIREDQSFFRSKGRIITKHPVLLELSLGTEFTDLLSGNLVLIHDPVGKSEFVSPSLSYNFHDEGTLVVGAHLFGNHGTEGEFRGAKPSAFFFIRWHF